MSCKIRNVGRPKNLFYEAMNAIKEAIFSGEFAAGDVLPNEKELSHLLGVSRPVLREAVSALQVQGFLEVRRGNRGGTFVTDLDNISLKDNIEELVILGKISVTDLNQARLQIEPEVFRLATLNASQEQLDDLDQVIKKISKTIDPEEKIKLRVIFHRLVGKACGNNIYSRFMDIIMDFTESFALTIKPSDKDLHEEKSHQMLYKALCRRDDKLIVSLAQEHIRKLTTGLSEMESSWIATKKQESD